MFSEIPNRVEVVPGNKDMESNEQKEDAPAMNPNSVDNQSKEGGKPPLFKECTQYVFKVTSSSYTYCY